MKTYNRIILSGLLGCLVSSSVHGNSGIIHRGDYVGREDVERFIASMALDKGFESYSLRSLLAQAERQERVLELVSKPAEGKEWVEYRPIFVNDKRIDAGVAFWNKNKALLERAEREFQVPAEIIVAIIGVETFYGTRMGTFPVLDTLVTLGFDYPPRADFFRKQLVEFLELTREEDIAPLEPKGSYAAAMGMGQFISSSYRDFAVDFDGDGHRNLFTNVADGIGSVANYFKQHGWQMGQAVAAPAYVKGNAYQALEANQLAPSFSVDQLAKSGVQPSVPASPNEALSFLVLNGERGEEYWVGHQNFYVITRYNHSVKYALAVFQLSEAIKRARLVGGR